MSRGFFVHRSGTGNTHSYFWRLWTQSHAAFQCKGLAAHIFEIRRSQLYADTTDFLLGIAIMACRRHFHILLKSFRVAFFEILKLGGPGQRAYDIYIDIIFTPFRSRHPCEAADAFLGRCVSIVQNYRTVPHRTQS